MDYIDGLRGVAIALVMMTHAWVGAGAPALSFRIAGYLVVLAAVPAAGWSGVTLFLVLSGFCLTWPFATGKRDLQRTSIWSFWRKRARRILPAYYCSILLLIGANAIAGMVTADSSSAVGQAFREAYRQQIGWHEILSHLVLAHNLMPSQASTLNGNYWSLALEFQLYLVFPLLATGMLRWRPWVVLSALLATTAAYRWGLAASLPTAILDDYSFVLPKALFGRCFDFGLGMVAALVVARRLMVPSRVRSLVPALTVVSVVAAFGLTSGGARYAPVYDLLWPVGFASIIVWAAAPGAGTVHRVLSSPLLVRLGVVSYSVYLTHGPLLTFAGALTRTRLHAGPAFLVLLGALPLVALTGSCFYFICERPFLARAQRSA